MNKLVKLGNTALVLSRPKLQTFLKYARVELRPPTPKDWPEIQRGFQNLIKSAKTGKYRELTVKEAAINTAIGVEIACWFFLGEIIGRRHFVGYYVAP